MYAIVLILLGYIAGLVIHILLFRLCPNFKYYVDEVIDVISPSTWCMLWPIMWIPIGLHYIDKLLSFFSYVIDYFISK